MLSWFRPKRIATPQWPLERDAEAFFGPPGTSQIYLTAPYAMYYAGKLTTRFSIHRLVHDSALRALQHVASVYTEGERAKLGLDQFSGCLNVRHKTGGTSWSTHAWGAAIDFDAARNPFRPRDLRSCPLMHPDAEEFWRAWEREGWTSLGRACGFDPMHVQAPRIR